MAAPQNIIAVIFDFDDTLTDDSTTALLEHYGIDPVTFWRKDVSRLVDDGWNPTLAYLNLLLENVGENQPLGPLKNSDLRSFGSKLAFYPGIPEIFDELQEQVEKYELSRPRVEFYVISGGLEEIIKGTTIARHLYGIWGCRFAEARVGKRRMIRHIMSAVSFTEKTKHLFEISKGISPKSKKPYQVNMLVEEAQRRVPLKNMIYVGDGLTDVPCFSLLSVSGGTGFGVFDPNKDESPKQAWQRLVAPQRVRSIHSPKYGKRDDLGAMIRAAVDGVCLNLELKMQMA